MINCPLSCCRPKTGFCVLCTRLWLLFFPWEFGSSLPQISPLFSFCLFADAYDSGPESVLGVLAFSFEGTSPRELHTLFPENRFLHFIIRFLFLRCDLVQIVSPLYRSSGPLSGSIGSWCSVWALQYCDILHTVRLFFVLVAKFVFREVILF